MSYYNGEKSYTNLTWVQDRQLASITTDGSTYTYGYDGDGIRTQKVVDGVTHTYVTQNGKVMRETIGTGATAKVLDFIYDNNGKPFALIYTNGTAEPETYYYVLNRQGDVVALMTASRQIVARYTYNAWGKVLSVTNANGTAITSASHIANLNPIRYRGYYYYDTETGFYYLQSRYYDPANHRFLTADVLFDRGVGFVGFNLYLYCGNNPVNRKDASGFDSVKVDDGDGDILELETYGGGSGGGSGRDVGGGNNSGGTSQGNGGGSATPSVSAAGKSPGYREQKNPSTVEALKQTNQREGNSGIRADGSYNFDGRKNSAYAEKRGWNGERIQQAIDNGARGRSINMANGGAACDVYGYPGSSNQYIVVERISRNIVQVSDLYDSEWGLDPRIVWDP